MKNIFNYYQLLGQIEWMHRRIKRYIGKKQKRLDFIGIGVAKAGTSALHDYLIQHPQIGMGDKKEIHFFDQPQHFFFPNWFYFRYHKHFNFKSGKKVYGEITPIYLYWRSAAADIWEYNPKIKLIVILRNPVDRAYSQWNMNIQNGSISLSFNDAIDQEIERAKRKLPYQHHKYSIIDRGFYSAQIREYLRFFPKNQLLFIQYDRFTSHTLETLEAIFEFLQVDKTLYHFSPLTANVFKYDKQMDPETRKSLINFYCNEIHEVEKMLNWNCSHWLE